MSSPDAYNTALAVRLRSSGWCSILVFWPCGEKLPQVYSALGMDKPEPVPKVCYAQMSKQLRRDPFVCVLCGGRMVYRRAVAGLNVQGLKIYARKISLMRYIPA